MKKNRCIPCCVVVFGALLTTALWVLAGQSPDFTAASIAEDAFYAPSTVVRVAVVFWFLLLVLQVPLWLQREDG